MNLGPLEFPEVWLVDFEFGTPIGERPIPVCMVAREFGSGHTIRLWEDDLQRLSAPPYSIDRECLLVAYYASAEIACHLKLGWRPPVAVLDLYAEFRNLTNGRDTPCGSGLIGAMTWFGLDGLSVIEKEEMRELAKRGGPWTAAEREALLIYCEKDVVALAQLLPKMLPTLDIPRALLRGRYMVAAARMEHAGVPIDVEKLNVLRENWDRIQDELIRRVDSDYLVYQGRTFKADLMVRYVLRNQIPWPRLASGRLALDDDTFKIMATAYPRIEPLRQLRGSLSQMRLSDLAVGTDGRNRCILSAFGARSGRNTPGNSSFIFGAASWLRGLIRPVQGRALAYIDWSQQEFGIAAAQSRDPAMMQAYESGDPYRAFAEQAGAIPRDGFQETHEAIRSQFKTCALGVLYDMGIKTLALRIGQPTFQARELLRLHHETYSKFWKWSDAAVDCAMLHGTLQTAFGWTIHAGAQVNPRFLRNFPMQGNGAEMLRLACCLITECGVTVCAPVHDALLIEVPLDDLESTVRRTQEAMAEASAIVLGGFRLRSEAKIIRYPERFEDKRGARMWSTVWDLIAMPAVVPAVVGKINVVHSHE